MKISLDLLKKIFPIANTTNLKEFVAVFNEYSHVFGLDTPERAAHFFAQLLEEVGPKASIREENFNYSTKALKKIFKRFHNNPKWAEKYGRNKAHASNAFMIASIAYADRMGNDDIASGDGWKYRGRGLMQLTGKSNYKLVNTFLKKTIKFDQDLVLNHDLAGTPNGAMLTAMAYWKMNKLHKIADNGNSLKVVDKITKVINRRTKSYGKRRKHFTSIYPKVMNYA